MLSKPKTIPTISIVENPVGAIAQALNFRTYNTPKILQASMFAIWGLGLVWIPVSIGAIQSQRNAVKTIADDSVTSVLLAQRIIDAMSDADAMLASDLLGEVDKKQDPEQALLIQPGDYKKLPKDQQPFNKRRFDMAERLTDAAKNITFEGEREAILQLNLNFGEYLAYTERAQAAHAKGDRAKALAEYQRAAQLLDETMIPTAEKLREINSKELDKFYDRANFNSGAGTFFVALLGLATIGSLVALQLFLRLRTRRTLNPMLLGATVVALLFLLNSINALLSSGSQLRVLKEDSYNSILAMRRGRALLYGANSDESRYLLDAVNRTKHEDSFMKKTAQVFSESNNQSKLAKTIDNLQSSQPNTMATGYFATEINNITSLEERTAVTKMMQEYMVYMGIDQQIRGLVAAKNIPAATELCLGQSNTAFENMKKAMDDAIATNKKTFDAAKYKAFAHLGTVDPTEQNTFVGYLKSYEVKATIALGAMATLVFFGLRPRMREYL